jgi:hypothetical protein
MDDKLEKFIKMVYGEYKSASPAAVHNHPDEENMACFLEGRLPSEEAQLIKLHLLSCESCADAFAVQLKIDASDESEVPKEAIANAKKMAESESKYSLLEISLWLKGRNFELLHTNGDVLVGQELVPSPVLRSRKIKDFKDEVTVLKDFDNIRVEVKVENKSAAAFSVAVFVKEKHTSQPLPDVRVTLLKDNIEMESYVTDTGKVTFDSVEFGTYALEISNIEHKFASITLDVKI